MTNPTRIASANTARALDRPRSRSSGNLGSPQAAGAGRGWSEELVREIAMDIGKEAVHHLEIMYPAAVAAVAPNMKLSLRNCIHNEIMAALKTNDADEIVERLCARRAFRKESRAAWKKIRSKPHD